MGTRGKTGKIRLKRTVSKVSSRTFSSIQASITLTEHRELSCYIATRIRIFANASSSKLPFCSKKSKWHGQIFSFETVQATSSETCWRVNTNTSLSRQVGGKMREFTVTNVLFIVTYLLRGYTLYHSLHFSWYFLLQTWSSFLHRLPLK